jgi:hypothetical protein
VLTVTDLFLNRIRYSNTRVTVADIYFDGGLLFGDIPIKSGSLTIDRNADIRRSGSISLASNDVDLSNFEPNGLEVNIRSGVIYNNGNRELVSLGWFRTETFSRQEGVSKEITVDLFDRGKVHQDIQTFIDVDRGGLSVAQAVQVYTSYSFAGLGYTPLTLWDPSFNQNKKLPGGSVASGTHLDAMKMIALTIAGEFYFDTDGNQVFGVIPKVSPTGNVSVWDIDVGATGVLVAANRTNTRANTYNGVSVLGASAEGGTRAYAIVTDSNPTSPTYWTGPFGRKTQRIETDTLTTKAQCYASAVSQLQNLTGLSKKVSFTSLWNPALEEGDICLFTFLDGTQEYHLIDSLSFNFESGEMTGETRTAQYVT